jgi:hypothetical protein
MRTARGSLLIAASLIPFLAAGGLAGCQPGPASSASSSPAALATASQAPSSPSPLASAAPLPTQPVAPSASLVSFTSSRYGYSVSYPANWKSRASAVELDPTTYPADFQTGTDYFSATSPDVGDPGLVIAGPLVASGTTLTSWAATFQKLQLNDLNCPAADASEDIQIGGQPGRLLTWSGCPAYLLWAGVVHGNRAYHIAWIDQFATGNPTLQSADKALFLKIVASFKFTTSPS